METNNETVEDVCDELRAHDLVPPPRGAWVMYADRILAAHKREMMHNESLLRKAGETVVGLMNKASAQSAEIAKLRAALKPVLEVEWHKVWNGPDGWNEYGDPLPSQAVKESQRIYKEVGNEER